MTENKRFTETVSTGIVTDNMTNKEYNCEMRIDDNFLHLINNLADENEQLKSRVEYLERKIDRERTSYQKQHEKWEEEIQKEINQELSNIISAIEKGSCRSRWFS